MDESVVLTEQAFRNSERPSLCRPALVPDPIARAIHDAELLVVIELFAARADASLEQVESDA
eukprot:6902745-Pyramimonas_sp.AAC.1